MSNNSLINNLLPLNNINNKILKIIFYVLFGTLLLAVSSKVQVPFWPVPMTMQTFVVLIIAMAYGWKLSLLTLIAYLLEGAIGLPGTSGFIGEFLILIATFKKNFLVATIASLGVILAAAYMLWLYKRVVFGKLINDNLKKMVDLKKSEILILWSLALPTILFGFYPEPIINTIEVSVSNLIEMYNLNVETYLAKNN